MPSKSAKQARFMAAVAHNPKFAKKAGVPQSVGQEYYDADHKASGGSVNSTNFGYITAPHMADGGSTSAEDLLSTAGGLSKLLPILRGDALMTKGLASQVLTYDQDADKMKLGLHPGLVDEMAGLPAAFGANWGWSKKAEDRLSKSRKRIQDVMGIDPASGFLEKGAEAAGEMLGQLPLPAGKLRLGAKVLKQLPRSVRYMSKVPGAMMEYLSPTIEPKLSNYLAGTAAGTVLGGLGGDDSPDEMAAGYGTFPAGRKDWVSKAKGGLMGQAQAIRGLSEAITHLKNDDHQSAFRSLSAPGVIDIPEVAQIMSVLRGPENLPAEEP